MQQKKQLKKISEDALKTRYWNGFRAIACSGGRWQAGAEKTPEIDCGKSNFSLAFDAKNCW